MNVGSISAASKTPANTTVPRFGWSFVGHTAIEQASVHLLPNSSYQRFLEAHLPAVTRFSRLQDTQKHGPGHFINLESYDTPFTKPKTSFNTVSKQFPVNTKQAKAQDFAQNPLQAHRLAPHDNVFSMILRQYRQLVSLLAQTRQTPPQDAEPLSAQLQETLGALAHYVGDLHQPLHATRHYTWTLARSIKEKSHAHLERRMMQPADYQDWLNRVTQSKIKSFNRLQTEADVQQLLLRQIEQSHLGIYDLVAIDRNARRQHIDKTHYAKTLRQGWKPIVETRMTKAAQHLAQILQNAYKAAGEPDLQHLSTASLSSK